MIVLEEAWPLEPPPDEADCPPRGDPFWAGPTARLLARLSSNPATPAELEAWSQEALRGFRHAGRAVAPLVLLDELLALADLEGLVERVRRGGARLWSARSQPKDTRREDDMQQVQDVTSIFADSVPTPEACKMLSCSQVALRRRMQKAGIKPVEAGTSKTPAKWARQDVERVAAPGKPARHERRAPPQRRVAAKIARRVPEPAARPASDGLAERIRAVLNVRDMCPNLFSAEELLGKVGVLVMP